YAGLRQVVVDEVPIEGLVPLHLEGLDLRHVATVARRPALPQPGRLTARGPAGEAPARMGAIRVLRQNDIRAALPRDGCIDAVEAAFVAYSSGAAELPGVIHLDVPEAGGEVHIKAGHLHGAPSYAVKVSSGFSGVDPPAYDGMVIVFDAST